MTRAIARCPDVVRDGGLRPPLAEGDRIAVRPPSCGRRWADPGTAAGDA